MDAVKPTLEGLTPAAIEISGTVSVLYFQKPTFSAGVIFVRGRDVKFSVKGYVKAGEPVTLRGNYENHKKYGHQFVATEVVYSLPTNIEGLGKWLEWYGEWIGPVKATKLIDEFGLDLMPLCVRDPQQVAACAGIPIESIHRLAERWQTHSNKVAAASQLAAWGLTQAQTEAILARFGGSSVTLIKDDPFAVLGRVDGFGWKTTDELAAKIGVTGDDPRRLRGAVAAVVRERYDNGHTATPLMTACELAAEKIGARPEVAEQVEATISLAVEQGKFKRVADDKPGKPWPAWLATTWGHECEATVWRILQTAKEPNPQFDRGEPGDSDYKLFENYAKLRVGDRECELDNMQLSAVERAAMYRISVVTGGAGAGKTLVARQITKLFLDGDVRVMLAAPTGKAARRLEEVIGMDASTIHRLLQYGGKEGRFLYCKDNPLPPGVVIVDEASMIDADLAYHLLTALSPDTALVLIGDPNQLPPVGPGAILRDVLAHDLAPVTRLEKCHRQAGTLKQNCNAILKGVVEPWASDEEPSPWVVSRKCDSAAKTIQVIEDMYTKYLTQWGYDPITDTQFMTARHDGPLGTRQLNLILQRLHQGSLGNVLDLPDEDAKDRDTRPTFYVGDKVIHTRNNYELEVMNGTVGVVIETRPNLIVKYEDKTVGYPRANEGEVSLAYCLTPHKCQGSEYPCAVVIIPKAHAFMQHRHWSYTAVTRAKRTAVIIGDDDGIRRAVERVENDRRVTLLQVFVGNEGARP